MQITPESVTEIKDLDPKQMKPKPALVVSRDVEDVDADGGEVMFLGTRERRSEGGGMVMKITVGEVLRQRRDPLPYAWKCHLGK